MIFKFFGSDKNSQACSTEIGKNWVLLSWYNFMLFILPKGINLFNKIINLINKKINLKLYF